MRPAADWTWRVVLRFHGHADRIVLADTVTVKEGILVIGAENGPDGPWSENYPIAGSIWSWRQERAR